MKRKFSTIILSLFLAVIMATILPLQAYASKPTYMKEIVFETASTVKKAKDNLIAKGYTPLDNNLNKGNKNAVVMGYKPTNDKSEAITDISVVEQNGNYSLANYTQILENKSDQVNEMFNDFKDAVSEFKKNYEKNDACAIYAYAMLNYYTNDDMNDVGVGDMLLSKNTTDEQLKTMLLESNSDAIEGIEQYLEIACSTKDWFSELPNCEEVENPTADDYDRADVIYSSLELFQNGIKNYEQLNIADDATKEEIDEFIKSATDSEQSTYIAYSYVYKMAKETDYLGEPVYNLFMTDLSKIDKKDLVPMAREMSKGEIATFGFTPITTSIMNSLNDDDYWDDALENKDKNSYKNDVKTISVYFGVDRSIYAQDGIALTDEAIKREKSTGENAFGATACEDWEKSSAEALINYSLFDMAFEVYHNLSNAPSYLSKPSTLCKAISFVLPTLYKQSWISTFVRMSLLPIGIVVSIAQLIIKVVILIDMIRGIDTWSVEHPKYTVIPKVIIDSKTKNDSSNYLKYTCAKDLSDKCADLNAWDGKDWIACYYTKDTNAGNPLTTDYKVQYGKDNASISATGNDKYRAVHYFSQSNAYNLNFNSDYQNELKNENYTYMFFVEDSSSYTVASVFSKSVPIALSAFGGIIVGALIIALIYNNKSKKKVEDLTTSN